MASSEASFSTLERAAQLFGVLATPVRLKILASLKGGEQDVTALLARIDASQPNMSRHLSVLHQHGVVARRREGQHIFYRIADPSVVLVCDAMCTQLTGTALELCPAV